MLRKILFLVIPALAIVLASCGSAYGAAPATAPAAAVATPAATPASTAVAPAIGTSSSPTAQTAGATGDLRWVLVPADSTALFRAREQLAGRDLPSDAVGKTNAVTGAVVLAADGKVISPLSKFVIDLQSLQTDSGSRDRYIKSNTLQTDQFPKAELVITGLQGLPSPLPTSGQVTFKVLGDLTIHGVTKPTTWDAAATVSGQDVTGTATTAVTFADFDMKRPKVAIVLSVEDNIRLELDFHMKAE